MSTGKQTSKPFSPEVRERAVRLVLEHREEYETQLAAIISMASKIGCSGETLRGWVCQAERNAGQRVVRSTRVARGVQCRPSSRSPARWSGVGVAPLQILLANSRRTEQ